MFSRIQDNLGRSLLIVFLIKPIIDLTYSWPWSIGGVRLAPTVLFAGLLFLYLLPNRFRINSLPPYARLTEAFIVIHLIAIMIGMAVGQRITLIGTINFMLRPLDSYLIYLTAFLAAIRYGYRDATPFVKAIVIGSSFAVALNVAALQLGISADFWASKAGGASSLRAAGLYYDPGVLGNVAFFNLVFVVFLLHLMPTRRLLVVVAAILLAMADLYLIASSKSRAVMVELAMFGMVYLWVFQKAWGKIVAPIAATIILAGSMLIFDISMEDLFVRFEGDVAAVSDDGSGEMGLDSQGRVSLGKYESLGNNRLAIWADALTEIYHRSLPEILLGNFSGSIAHSDYIDIVARTGLVGLALYLTIMISLTLYTWQLARRARRPQDRTLYFMAFTLLICYLFYSLPFRPLGYTTTAWYMWVVLGLAMARARLAPMEAAAAAKQQQENAGRGGDGDDRPDSKASGPRRPNGGRSLPVAR